jgi:acid phosphatase
MCTFLAIGGWGREGSSAQVRVARGLARAAHRLGARFVVTTGDNFCERGVTGLADPHWQRSFERVYVDPALRLPWYVALGERDHGGSVEAQQGYGRHNPRWNLPDRHYASTLHSGGTTLLLVVLDTTPFVIREGPFVSGAGRARVLRGLPGAGALPPAAEAQIGWLRATLARSRAQWKIVVGHHPILSGSPFEGGSPELQARVRPLLEEHGVHAWLCGHDRDLQHLIHGSLHHLVSGAAGEVRPTGILPATQFALDELGFLAVSVSRDRLAFRFLDADGEELYLAEEPAAFALP